MTAARGMSPNPEAVRRGVADACADWLDQHPVSVPQLVTEGVQEAVTSWLDANKEAVISSIAARAGQDEADPS